MRDEGQLKTRHRQMLEYQEENKPWTPTVEQMAGVWGITKFPALITLRQMAQVGMVITNKCGKHTSYYAIPEGSTLGGRNG